MTRETPAPADLEDPSDLADEDAELPPVDLTPEDEAAPASVKLGAAAIRGFWKHAPKGPGVYRMIGADGDVLYVGKAKSVRKRIASYMRPAGHTNRIARMIALTVSMVFVSTATETEALLLETNYIKQMKPRFNVLMRDDKSFPYILVTGDHAAPQITKHRGARSRKGDYFGPFASVWAVNRTLNALQRAFLLRSCTDSFYENRTRPCLLHQIKRCSAPCTGEINHTDYAALVGETRDFLSGKSRAVRDLLAREMMEASETMEFERAARLRDRIAALSAIQGAQGINPKTVEEADVFAVIEEGGQFCIEVFFFRTFQNWGNRAYYPKADKSLTPGEVLDAFLAQFYDDRPPPRLVLLSHEVESRALLETALCERYGAKVEIATPQRGEKRELVEAAAHNGRETLGRKMSETASQEKLLAALSETFGLERTIRRVEVYDNSHIMGTNAVGGMVVAGPNGFMKTHYRTFNIKDESLTPGDDFGMMREVLRRRFSRLLKEDAEQGALSSPVEWGRGTAEGGGGRAASLVSEDGEPSTSTLQSDGASTTLRVVSIPRSAGEESDPDAFPNRPDLILIDGGLGQFNATKQILDELGVTDVAIVGIAKGRDRDAGREMFFVEGKEPFRLAPRDPALYFVQRLRDEAHRFAIGTHRARRKKDFTRSPLDDIGGIGPARKRALLHAFGTAKALSRAALSDLEKVPGINAGTAKLVYDFFHERNGA
ncbi:excinuclease ABC subunit UvrC [Beijerinckia sp. L45]|uniref:excinuclease ABC subunit UvrC n=1 Tax=Beijerinckia sp. L45 TaxID=1641855 RepID=UPI00131B42D6|nr:excinuclease ABC subunit UvrC [Beijerinckia sp. L45]